MAATCCWKAKRKATPVCDSEAKGIVIVHQELALVPLLSVMENLFLGHERARFGVVDRKAQRELGRQALAKVGLDVDLTRRSNARRRQAAADRDRQGPASRRAPLDPRRAHRQPERSGTARPCST